jgi:hypothetical protein
MTWYLRGENSAGPADAGVFQFGSPGWKPVAGDWSGSGRSALGAVDPAGKWHRRGADGAVKPDRTFSYGLAGWEALAAAAPVDASGGGEGRTPGLTYSVKDFNAQGDGRTDDTAAINQAIETAYEAGGGTVLLPAGTYLVSIPRDSYTAGPAVGLRAFVRLQGDYSVVGGQPVWRSFIRLADGQGDYTAILGTFGLWGSLTGFAMDGVAVDGNRQGNPATSALTDYADPLHKRDCLLVTGGDGVSVTNCEFFNIDTLNAVALNSVSSRLTNARVANCLVRDVGGPLDHDTSFIAVRGDYSVIENNRVLGSAAAQACWAAYEVEGSHLTFRNNYAEQVQFAVQLVGDGAEGTDQNCTGNTFVDVLMGFQFWPFQPTTDPMHQINISGNTITVNRGLWVAGPVDHFAAEYWHGAIDVLVNSLDPESGYDGGTIDGLDIENNTIHFVNPAVLFDGEEPQVAIRLIRTYVAQNPVTITGLVVRGNTMTRPGGSDQAISPNPVVVGAGVSVPGAVIS